MGDPSNLDPDNRITLVSGIVCTPEQVGAQLTGPCTRLAYVCRTCPCNLHNGLCNRHLKKRNACVGDFSHFKSLIKSVELELTSEYVKAYGEWEEGWFKKWPESKRKLITKSVEIDSVRPSEVKCMVKKECGSKPPTKARCIQFYVNLKTQSIMAPKVYSLQKAFGKVLRKCGKGITVTFASGMNNAEIAEWMDFVFSDLADVRFYERDGKNWDASMGEEHQNLKEFCYAAVSGDSPLIAFLRACACVKGRHFSRHGSKVFYRVKFTTKSGHNDTTLGNSLVNAAIAYCVCLEMGLKAHIIVAGDDLIVAIQGDFDEKEFARRESEYGINPEYRKFSDYLDVTFISGMFLRTDEGFAFLPQAGRLLANLCWTIKPPSERKRLGYLRGVALGLWPTCGGLPVMGAWLRAIINQSDGMKVWYDNVFTRDYYEYTGNISYGYTGKSEFMRRYGLVPADVVEVESLLEKYATTPCLLGHPVLQSMTERDLADITERITHL